VTNSRKMQILKKQKQGYKAATIAVLYGITAKEVRSVIRKDESERAAYKKALKRGLSPAEKMLAMGYDPAIVRANFGE